MQNERILRAAAGGWSGKHRRNGARGRAKLGGFASAGARNGAIESAWALFTAELSKNEPCKGRAVSLRDYDTYVHSYFWPLMDYFATEATEGTEHGNAEHREGTNDAAKAGFRQSLPPHRQLAFRSGKIDP